LPLFISIDRHGRNFVALVYPKRPIDMNFLSLVMKKEMPALVRNCETLATRRVLERKLPAVSVLTP
jgi:hypothetical protein